MKISCKTHGYVEGRILGTSVLCEICLREGLAGVKLSPEEERALREPPPFSMSVRIPEGEPDMENGGLMTTADREWPLGTRECREAAPPGTKVRNSRGEIATKTRDLLWEWDHQGGATSLQPPAAQRGRDLLGAGQAVLLEKYVAILEDHPGNHIQTLRGPPSDSKVRHAYLEPRTSSPRGGRGMADQPCKCNHYFSCGGRGDCGLSMGECIAQHFVSECEHVFDGPWVGDDFGGTKTCSKCGTEAMGHDMLNGP